EARKLRVVSDLVSKPFVSRRETELHGYRPFAYPERERHQTAATVCFAHDGFDICASVGLLGERSPLNSLPAGSFEADEGLEPSLHFRGALCGIGSKGADGAKALLFRSQLAPGIAVERFCEIRVGVVAGPKHGAGDGLREE